MSNKIFNNPFAGMGVSGSSAASPGPGVMSSMPKGPKIQQPPKGPTPKLTAKPGYSVTAPVKKTGNAGKPIVRPTSTKPSDRPMAHKPMPGIPKVPKMPSIVPKGIGRTKGVTPKNPKR